MLVKRGPIKILKENDEFPKEPNRGRHFSSKLYIMIVQMVRSKKGSGLCIQKGWIGSFIFIASYSSINQ
jgi:hypothetical protein